MNSVTLTRPGMHVLAKPIGPVCDIACDYCFYLEKRGLFRAGEQFKMPDDVLAAYIRQYVEAQPTPVVEFVWHGGEPTLAGLDFFRSSSGLLSWHPTHPSWRWQSTHARPNFFV